MTAKLNRQFDRVLSELESVGLLLVSDANFPSVHRLISPGPIRGSWWSHPDAQSIFAVCQLLEDHRDVLTMKLVSGKVTFVHRILWHSVYSIATARNEWQTKKLSAAAKALLKQLEVNGSVETKTLPSAAGQKPGEIARELEARMLVHSEQIHTSSGAHAKILETWPSWAKRIGYKPQSQDPLSAQLILEEKVATVATVTTSPATRNRLPWQTKL